jgi:hypothetical protein
LLNKKNEADKDGIKADPSPLAQDDTQETSVWLEGLSVPVNFSTLEDAV